MPLLSHIKRNILSEIKSHSDINKLMRILKSKSAYDILDNSDAPDTTFQFGGCWILADALSELYDLPIFVVYNNQKNMTEHFVVKVGSMFLDSDGLQSENNLIRKVAEDGMYDENDLEVIEYNESLNTEGIIRDPEASDDIVELIKKVEING